MTDSPGAPRILFIDTNVYFSKRLGNALKVEGFDVVLCTQAAYALTMVEWTPPAAILCATNLREMGALEMAPILHADAKAANIPIIAVGAGGEEALLEAYRAGCDDYVDRRLSPSEIAAHIRRFLLRRRQGIQSSQMLLGVESEGGAHRQDRDLAGVIERLSQARQTGALHVRVDDADGIIFFADGEMSHAECGALFGEKAVTKISKRCQGPDVGLYQFVEGATAAQRTVFRSATDLLLDATEFDETGCEKLEKESA